MTSVKYTKVLLDNYCKENNIKLNKDYSNEKINRKTRIIGICEIIYCENNFDCALQNLINFGALCKTCFYKKKQKLQKKLIKKNMVWNSFHKSQK
jgi:hypothetical protein